MSESHAATASETARDLGEARARAVPGVWWARTALGTLLLLSAATGGWNAWTFGPDLVVWPNARCVRYLMPSSFPAGAAHTQQLLWSMGDWSSIDKCAFDFFYQILPQDYATDHYDGYSDTIAVDPADLDPGVLAVTYSVNDEAQWFDMDMEYSDFPVGVGWNFILDPTCEEEALPGASGFCFMLACLHECGHSIGLAHEPTGTEPPGAPWIVCTMNPAYAHGGSNGSARVFETHADDRLGARTLYPGTGAGMIDIATLNFTWSETYVGVPFTVFCSPSMVNPGADLTIRSGIENRGSVDVPDVVQQFWMSEDDFLDSSDIPLGELPWALGAGAYLDFDLGTTLPPDIAAGAWKAITILDPANVITEAYEDNNDAVYCVSFTVAQMVPEIVAPLGQHFTTQGVPWQSPTPAVTKPLNAAPLVWSLVGNPPQGVTINDATGRISWQNPIASQFQYMLFVRASNGAGSDTEILYLGVGEEVCVADLNGDNTVNGQDLSLVLGFWGSASSFGDVNGDGSVDGLDLAFVFAEWGPCP